MKHFYHVPTATYNANRPNGWYHQLPSADDPTLSLVVVEHWNDGPSQDAWEALPGVIEYPLWAWSSTVPSYFHRAHSSHGVKPTHSIGDAMREIRRHWSAARL
jgi:hypothetical protein